MPFGASSLSAGRLKVKYTAVKTSPRLVMSSVFEHAAVGRTRHRVAQGDEHEPGVGRVQRQRGADGTGGEGAGHSCRLSSSVPTPWWLGLPRHQRWRSQGASTIVHSIISAEPRVREAERQHAAVEVDGEEGVEVVALRDVHRHRDLATDDRLVKRRGPCSGPSSTLVRDRHGDGLLGVGFHALRQGCWPC